MNLKNYENKVFSQHGEDGVIDIIFKSIKENDKFYLEIGTESGNECNTRYLREHKRWNGIMFDAVYENTNINLFKHKILIDNVFDIYEKYNLPKKFDLMSIDIDSNDFYILNETLKKYSPRCIVLEYNASHLPPDDKVVIYNPDFEWNESNYFGMSLTAAKNLCNKHGYELVYCESSGTNAFFIKSETIKENNLYLENINNEKELFVRSNFSGPNGGYKIDPLGRQFVNSTNII